MKKLLAKVHLKRPADISFEGVARILGVSPADLDPEFGIVRVDAHKHEYVVRVVAGSLPINEKRGVQLYNDSAIETYG